MRDPRSLTETEITELLIWDDHFRSAERLHDYISWHADANGDLTYVSAAKSYDVGEEGSAYLGRSWLNFVHPEDVPGTVEHFDRSIATGEPMQFTNRYRFAQSDSYRWMRVSAHPRRREDGTILCWYGTTTDINDLVRHEHQQKVLLDELNHRVKNSLTTVQAIVMQTFRSLKATDLGDVASYELFCDKVMERLQTLSAAHDLLTRNSWSGAHLDKVITKALSAIMDEKRFRVLGPKLDLSPNAALLMAMIFHELATNAIKYGCWANDTGTLLVRWSIADNEIRLNWVEKGGPEVTEPSHTGFGTKLITHGGLREIGGKTSISYCRDGLRCCLSFPISDKVRLV